MGFILNQRWQQSVDSGLHVKIATPLLYEYLAHANAGFELIR